MSKKPGYGLFIALFAVITAVMIGAGELWPLKSVFADKEQEKAIWEDLNGIASGIRVYVQEKGYPPESLSHLVSEDYVAPITEVSTGSEYCWTMHYGKVNVFLGEVDEATGAETYIHDSKGKPFLASVEYNSPEPVVFIRDLNNKVHSFDVHGHYLYNFFIITKSVTGNVYNIAWHPQKDILLYADASTNKIYEYALQGDLLDSWDPGYTMTGSVYAWVDYEGRYYFMSYIATAGSKGLVCMSPERTELWYKTATTNNEIILSDSNYISSNAFTGYPEVIPCTKFPNGGFLAKVCHLGTTASAVYDPAGNRTLYIGEYGYASTLPTGDFLYNSWGAIYGRRFDQEGIYKSSPSDYLYIKDGETNLNVYSSAWGYGKHYILERRAHGGTTDLNSRLHTFDYNNDFSAPKQNYVVSTRGSLLDAISICIRRTAGAYVGVIRGSPISKIVKINNQGVVESTIDLTPFGFGNRSVFFTPNRDGIYITTEEQNGITHIDHSGNLIRQFGDHKHWKIAFDSLGRLWVGGAIDGKIYVYDVTPNTPILLFEFDCGIIYPSITKDPYGRMWVTSYSQVDPNMQPKVYDINGNLVEEPTLDLHSNVVSKIAFNSKGEFYICDYSTGVFQKYSPTGKLLIDKNLFKATDMFVDNIGNVWACDYWSCKMKVFDHNLNLLKEYPFDGNVLSVSGMLFDQPTPELFVSQGDGGVTFDQSLAASGKYGEYGTLPGKFRDPSDIAVAGNKIFQVDKGNKRINVLTYQGSYLSELGTDELNDPSSCAIDPLTGRLFVVDKEGTTEYVKVFDADGVYLGVVRNGIVPKDTVTTGDQYTFKDVSGLGYYGASGYSSRLAIADRGNSRVQVMDGVGYIFKSIPCDDPVDVTFDELGNIYILDDDAIDVYNTSGVLQSTLNGPGWSITNGSSLSYYKDELFIVDQDGLLRLGKDGVYKGRRSMTGLKYIGVAQDVLPYIYVADGDKDKILAYDAWGNYMTEWGESGNDPEQLNSPSAVGVDGDGNVYVADSSDYIKKYDKDGVFLFRFGGPGVFDDVLDITVHKDNLYITESGASRVQLFDTNGTFQSIVAESGSLPGQVSGSGCIGINPLDDSLWIPDSGNNRLQSYDGGNNFALISGQYGTTEVGVNESPNLNNPTAISVIGDTLYVLDSGNKKIRALDSSTGNFKSNILEDLPVGLNIMKNDISGRIFVPWNGILAVIRGGSEEVGSIGDTGSGRGQLSNPSGLAVLPVYKERIPGSIFVLGTDQKIRAYDKDMNLLYSFGGKSYGVGELVYPYDIIQNPSGNVHVLDRSRIYTFTYDGELLNSVPRPSTVYVLYEIGGEVYGGRTSTNLDYSDWIKVNNNGTITYVPWWQIPYHVDSNGYGYRQILSCSHTQSPGPAVNKYQPNNGSYMNVFMNYLGGGSTNNGVFYDNSLKARYFLQLIWKGSKAYAISYGTVGIYDIDGKLLQTKNHGMREPVGSMTQWKPTDYGFLGVGDGYWKFKRYDNDFNVIENVNLGNLPPLYKASTSQFYNGGWWNSLSNTYFMTDARTKVAIAFKSGATEPLKTYGYYNKAFNNFSATYEINADDTGVYVRDYGNGNLKKFDLFGKPLWIYGPVQNEATVFSSHTSTRYFSLDDNCVYVPDFYHRYIHVIDKHTGVRLRTISTPSDYNMSAQMTADGKLVSGRYGVTSSTQPLYFIGDKNNTTLSVAGPSNPEYHSLYGGGSSQSRGQNQIACVKDLVIVKGSWGGNMWIYNSSGAFLGRKTFSGNYMSDIHYVASLDEVWLNPNGTSIIRVYDYSTFLSASDLAGKEKRVIALSNNTYCFAYVD